MSYTNPEERGQLILETLHKEAMRVFQETGSTAVHDAHLTIDQAADMAAYSDANPGWSWAKIGLPDTPFKINFVFTDEPIEGIRVNVIDSGW